MKFLLVFSLLGLVACSSNDNGGGSNPSPVVKKDCTSPFGGLVKHGETIQAYKSDKVPAGSVCESEVRTCNDGALSGSFTHKACEVLADEEPSTHEKPMRINDKDLKVGGVKEVSKKSLYKSADYSAFPSPKPNLDSMAQCAASVQLGAECSQGQALCKKENTVFSCETKTTYKVFGWVYEEIGRDYKAAEGVKADIFWFTGCMAGMCDVVAGPVYTDKYGYFEILTHSLLDQVRLNGLDVGLYAHCIKGKPSAGGGQSGLGSYVGKPFPDAFAHQKRIKPDSCK